VKATSSGIYGSTVPLVSTSIYDFNTAKVISTTDVNNKTTSYDYTDSLNRLTQVTMPDTARVRYNYFNTPGDLYVQGPNSLRPGKLRNKS